MVVFTSCNGVKKASTSTNTVAKTSGLQGRTKILFDETYFGGLSAKFAGDDKTAMVNFQQCLTLDPNNSAVKYELSQIYGRLGNNAKAVETAEEVAEAEPDNIWYQENLAKIYQTAKMFAKSAKVYEKLIEQKPNQISYYYELGSVYLFSNNATGAIRTYENLEALVGFDNALSEQLFKLYDHQKMDDKAEAKMVDLIERNPTEIRYVSILASFYKEHGETQKAIDLYERLKREHPNDPYVKLALYEYYNEIGEQEKAFKNLEDAFSSKEVNIDSKVGILLALMDLADQNQQIKVEVDKLMEIMAATHPDSPKTWAIYGDYLNIHNEKARARKMFLKSIALDSSKYQVWTQVLFIDSELADEEAMFSHASQCKELFPDQVLPYFFLGMVYMQREDYTKAISQLEQAKELAYGMQELEIQISGNLGDAYYQSGNTQKAWLSYDNALRMNPSNDYVLNNYAYFLSVEGENLDQAKKMSKQTVDRNPKSATYLDTYGWILYKMGDYEGALKYLEMAKKYSTTQSGEILEHLGDASFKLGKVDDALLNWKSAKELGGGTEELDAKIKNKKL